VVGEADGSAVVPARLPAVEFGGDGGQGGDDGGDGPGEPCDALALGEGDVVEAG